MALQILRRNTGGAGAPASLRSGQMAVNFVDGWLYIGSGDDGSGNATSIVRICGVDKFMELTGNQTVSGIKTFAASPVFPTPAPGTNNTQAATTGFVAAALSAISVAWENVTGKPATFPPSEHSAALITSGTLDPARLPPTAFQAPIVSSGTLANLTAQQQNDIRSGTIVLTTDGVMRAYSGTGSKTDAASYIVLADSTPEWSVVANKPANVTSLAGLTLVADRMIYATGAGTFAVTPITAYGRTLVSTASAAAARTALGVGTMGTQNANAVAITGGTLTGIDADFGTF